MTLHYRPRALSDIHSLPTPAVAMDTDELLAEAFFEQGASIDREAGDDDSAEDDPESVSLSLRRRLLAEIVAAVCALSLSLALAAAVRAL